MTVVLKHKQTPTMKRALFFSIYRLDNVRIYMEGCKKIQCIPPDFRSAYNLSPASEKAPPPLTAMPMRVLSSFFLLLALFAGTFSVVAPHQASAAATRQSRQPATAAPSRLDRLIKEFEALQKDEKAAQRRDLWLNLEEKGLRLAKEGKGENAIRAAYYAARSREELGKRSFRAADRREAVAAFEGIAKRYPKSPLAAAALYRQALVLKSLPGERSTAIQTLEGLLRRYPRARERAEAQTLLTSLRKDAAQAAEAAKNTKDKTSSGSSVNIRNMFWKGKPQRALITLELDGTAPYEYEFVPPDKRKKTPARIYLDITGAFPSSAIKPGVQLKDMAVSRIRTAQAGDGARIMFDCDGVRCFAVRRPKNAPRTIQIELSRKMDIKDGIAVEEATAEKKARQSEKKGRTKENPLLEQLGLTVKTIMIDAGHGGKDPGAMAGGITEKRFTLDMARRVGALLQKKGFTVLYTRANNSFISLQERPDIANRKKADLFISIHVNANTNPEIHGLETYYLDMATTHSAATVAARENAVSVKNISDLQVILTDLMLSSKLEESRELARCTHAGILQRLRQAKLSSADNGVRSAPFYVLMGARMPAILVEFGYITNKNDAANLKSEVFLQKQAEGLVEGILAYKAKLAKSAAR